MELILLLLSFLTGHFLPDEEDLHERRQAEEYLDWERLR